MHVSRWIDGYVRVQIADITPANTPIFSLLDFVNLSQYLSVENMMEMALARAFVVASLSIISYSRAQTLQDYSMHNITFHNCNATQGAILGNLVVQVDSLLNETVIPDSAAGTSQAFSSFYSTNHGLTIASVFRDLLDSVAFSTLNEHQISEMKFACLNEGDTEWYIGNMRWWCEQNSLITTRNEEWEKTFLCPLFWDIPDGPDAARCPVITQVVSSGEAVVNEFQEQVGSGSIKYNKFTHLLHELIKFYIPGVIPEEQEKIGLNDCVTGDKMFQHHHAWNYAYYATCEFATKLDLKIVQLTRQFRLGCRMSAVSDVRGKPWCCRYAEKRLRIIFATIEGGCVQYRDMDSSNRNRYLPISIPYVYNAYEVSSYEHPPKSQVCDWAGTIFI